MTFVRTSLFENQLKKIDTQINYYKSRKYIFI